MVIRLDLIILENSLFLHDLPMHINQSINQSIRSAVGMMTVLKICGTLDHHFLSKVYLAHMLSCNQNTGNKFSNNFEDVNFI